MISRTRQERYRTSWLEGMVLGKRICQKKKTAYINVSIQQNTTARRKYLKVDCLCRAHRTDIAMGWTTTICLALLVYPNPQLFHLFIFRNIFFLDEASQLFRLLAHGALKGRSSSRTRTRGPPICDWLEGHDWSQSSIWRSFCIRMSIYEGNIDHLRRRVAAVGGIIDCERHGEENELSALTNWWGLELEPFDLSVPGTILPWDCLEEVEGAAFNLVFKGDAMGWGMNDGIVPPRLDGGVLNVLGE